MIDVVNCHPIHACTTSHLGPQVFPKTILRLETGAQRRADRYERVILERRQRLGKGPHVELLDAKDDFFQVKPNRAFT
jgi:hypothetical protein